MFIRDSFNAISFLQNYMFANQNFIKIKAKNIRISVEARKSCNKKHVTFEYL